VQSGLKIWAWAWWSIYLGASAEVAFDGSIRGGAVFHSIAKGEAWKGLVVACFDCGKPGGQDWVTGRSVVEMDKRADAGKFIKAGGLWG
jgi:hypothetical protein